MVDDRVVQVGVFLHQLGEGGHGSPTSPVLGPDLLAEAEQAGQVVDVGVELGHGRDHLGPDFELVALGGLAPGDDREVAEVLPDLGEHPGELGFVGAEQTRPGRRLAASSAASSHRRAARASAASSRR